MGHFISSFHDHNLEASAKAMKEYNDAAATFFKPFVDGMLYENSYALKVPCYNKNLVNPNTPKECLRGSQWVTDAQHIMGGKIDDVGVKLNTFDNFHRVYVTTPHHLPQVNNTCPLNGKHPCTLQALTVSETYYDKLWFLDTGMDPHAATEHKAKMLSRQSVQWHAGHADADFHKLDEDDYLCASINQVAIDWGMKHASSQAVAEYNKYGKKLVVGKDKGPAQAGPEWIWDYLSYDDNSAKTQTTIRGMTMRLPLNYWEIQVQGNHYCKLLSPYRALEWIYIDSLKGKKPYGEDNEEELGFFQS